ncbi:MAG: hypothetical protein K6T29_05360 [Peptococcaceae bacterium]|nr:hypothetical protein [Peptococcaceae bacterium]
MSCSSLRHRFEEDRRQGLTFQRAMELYQDVDGSVAAHRTELEELMRTNRDQHEIEHLRQHIAEGEKLMSELRNMKLH